MKTQINNRLRNIAENHLGVFESDVISVTFCENANWYGCTLSGVSYLKECATEYHSEGVNIGSVEISDSIVTVKVAISKNDKNNVKIIKS